LEAVLDHHHGYITAMEFLEPYPILVTAGSDGLLCFWGLRPDLSSKFRVFHKVAIQSASEPIPITALSTLPKGEGLPDLAVGEERGHLYLLKADYIKEHIPKGMK